MARTTIIAELGENHVGDWGRAGRMVIAAAAAGADVVKVQSYRGRDVSEADPEKAWFTQVELSDEWHVALAALAGRHGVEFLSAPFTVERARFLCEQMGLSALKIASSEMLNRPLLEYANAHATTVYLSTGMATLDEVREAVARLDRVPDLVILHCVSQYPTKDDEANLQAIRTLREAFSTVRIGYSDHTIGGLAPLVAVALGASVIEKHFTLDKTLPGTDHLGSTTPEELQEMVQRIRQIERLLGTGKKEPAAAELAVRALWRARFPKG